MPDIYAKHDSQELYFRTPFGAVKPKDNVILRLEGKNIGKVELEIILFDGHRMSVPMEQRWAGDMQIFEKNIHIKEEHIGIINYYFTIYAYNQVFYYGNNHDGLGGEGRIYNKNPPYYQITVYREFKVPAWYKEGIVYQIFVDRFCNGNEDGKVLNPKKNSFIYANWDDEPMYIKDDKGDIKRWEFYGGNLKGVIKKLDYLKSLYVTVIYLNPIFESSSNHKYDTADYKKIDPMFGNEEIFKELCLEAEKRGIRIILDGVFSHTGADSVYFNKFGRYKALGAYQSKDSPYYNWYRFIQYPDIYECWWGIDNQPNVDELNRSYMDFIINDEDSVIKKWIKLGASGWRLDVADELPDPFIEQLKKEMKKTREDSVLIGEVWEDASNKISYSKSREYLFGHELDSVTNYPFRGAVISFLNGHITSHEFSRRMMSIYENYPPEAFYSNLNILGTHDTERILTMFHAKGDKAVLYMELAVAIQMTFPGVPLIYYGDEAGVKGGTDPDNRRTYPWGKENKYIMNLYRRLTSIRNKHDVFKKGNIRFYNSHQDILCFERFYGGNRAFVIVNRHPSNRICLDIPEQRLHMDMNPLSFKIIMDLWEI
ncbi:MAG: glycoside hydrolase family 13 protein [Xylanivirga thermophila]|jgi:cyclomaltodextrinase / maltogenic alpha-amylase / neopullulanase|uniref:alpha-amylase family glycosyl hydrolase n=1 Tax=Xylanivirga thermophila TaxID=2496273 RepID=UPI0039F5B9AA